MEFTRNNQPEPDELPPLPGPQPESEWEPEHPRAPTEQEHAEFFAEFGVRLSRPEPSFSF